MTTNDRSLFTIPDDPKLTYRDQPFYQWLIANEGELDTRRPKVVEDYLQSLEFDFMAHRIAPSDYDLLCTIWGAYCRLWMPCREPQTLDDLFVESHGRQSFWLSGTKFKGAGEVWPTDALKEMIEKTDPIYPVDPDHYFFEVINGVVYLKYQKIIGSRRLCLLEKG